MKREKNRLQFVSVVQTTCRSWGVPLAGLFWLLGLLACARLPLGMRPALTATPEMIWPTSSETAPAAPSPTPRPLAPAVGAVQPPPPDYRVRVHPDGGLYAGDQVSFEVIRLDRRAAGDQVQIQVQGTPALTLGPASFQPFGIEGRGQATFLWAWDTQLLAAGSYTLTFSILPDGPVWDQTVSLLGKEQLPPPEPEAHWASARSECCVLYYITGTDAAADIETLRALADEQARDAVQRMQIGFTQPLTLTLLPRVLGHGGFASQEIYISYLEQNYAGGSFPMIVHHEMIHILDARLGGDVRPNIFVEGLAVYLSGGHFRPESILPRAAALLDLAHEEGGWYIPLKDLANDFYTAQHEVGYLEGAALIAYLVERYGWEAFSAFYRDIHPMQEGDASPAAAIDAALKKHFSLSLDQLESQWIAFLRQQTFTPEQREDLRLTVLFYNTVRRYQQAYDPSAYFATAWLLDGAQMRQRGIVADYLRRPRALENLLFEAILIQAEQKLSAGEYAPAENLLNTINLALDSGPK